MNTEFTYPKRKYDKKDIQYMYLFFDNGDYVSIGGEEIVDLSVNVYDKLVWHGKGVSPVAAGGFVKLKVGNTGKYPYNQAFLYDYARYKLNRKRYIEQRCISEYLTEMWFFDELNWHNVVKGTIKAKMEGEYLILEFLPHPLMGSASGEVHSVNLGAIERKNIRSIDLDFENCESFDIYNNEILEMKLDLDEQLDWGAGDLYRVVRGGYMRIKLDENYIPRRNHMFNYFFDNKKMKNKDYEQRLCGKKGRCEHDLCHLYISYLHVGCGHMFTECVEISDIRPDEELDRIYEEDDRLVPDYIGGHCAKLQDGSIVIAFGVNSETTVNRLSQKFNKKEE